MRLDRLFVLLLSITLVTVSLFYFPTSSQESICRDGEIFNPELSRCEANPICPDGTAFNPDTDRCEQVPQCPTNSVYNKDRDKCEDLDPCPGGTIDSDGCTTEPELDCNFDTVAGFLNSDKICEIGMKIEELCPDVIDDAGVVKFHFTVDLCSFPISVVPFEGQRYCPDTNPPVRPICPRGTDLASDDVFIPPECTSNPCDEGVFNVVLDFCTASICDSGGYNAINHRCQRVIIDKCPSDLPNRDLAVCYREPNCSEGDVGFVADQGFVCDGGSRNTCPEGTSIETEGIHAGRCTVTGICPGGKPPINISLDVEFIDLDEIDSEQVCEGGVGTFNPNSKCPKTSRGPSDFSLFNDMECLVNGERVRDVCEEEPNQECTQGELENGKCVDSTPCPDGFDLVDSGGNFICEGPATCPADTALDTDEDLCLAEFECPEDTIFDPNTDLCIRLIVSIDIKPGSDPNCFNNDGKGVIPVAILGSDLFDVTLVDPATVQLDGMGLKQVGKGNKLLASIEDANEDGFDDLGVKIQDQDGVFSEDGTGTITGKLFDNTPFEGTDSVCIRPPSDTKPGQRGIVTDESDGQTDDTSFDTVTSDNPTPDIVTDDDSDGQTDTASFDTVTSDNPTPDIVTDESDGQTDDTSFDAVTSDNPTPDNQTVQRGMVTDDSDVQTDTASFFTVTNDNTSPNIQTSDIVTADKGSGGDEHLTRPTFGLSHENYETIVDSGFRFNDQSFTINDNFHTPFAQQTVNIGEVNSFEAKIYADKGLRVQEFLFGIPNVGEAHLAELGVEVWYDYKGEIEDVRAIQKSNVIDKETIVATHEKTKCQASDIEQKCDTTNVSMVFLEPLKDKVIAVKAIDYKNRFQITYLNEGVDIVGESLNPMNTFMVPSTIKGEGLVQVTQTEKYSPYWLAEDGRLFEMNSFGSFKQINQTFERFEDTGNAFTRVHSGFGGIIQYEQKRATLLFDSSEYISELPESFAYLYSESGERVTEEMKQKMLEQEEIAKKIIEESKVQARWH